MIDVLQGMLAYVLFVENLIKCLTESQCVTFARCKNSHCYSLCLNSVTVWYRAWRSVVRASVICPVCRIKKVCSVCVWWHCCEQYRWQLFLTLFGDSGFNRSQGGNRNNTRQQGGHMKKKKTREKGCQLDWWSENRVWLWEVQQPTYLP